MLNGYGVAVLVAKTAVKSVCPVYVPVAWPALISRPQKVVCWTGVAIAVGFVVNHPVTFTLELVIAVPVAPQQVKVEVA